MKKKTAKKSALPKGKSILFAHVATANKAFLKLVHKKENSKSEGRITLSNVADRMLTNLKRNPRLLKEALK